MRALSVKLFNHFSVTFGDVVWTGQSTRHVRQGLEGPISIWKTPASRFGIAMSPSALYWPVRCYGLRKVAASFMRPMTRLFAGVFAASSGGHPAEKSRSQTGGDAVRALHAGRGAIQVRGRIPDLLVFEKKPVKRSISPLRPYPMRRRLQFPEVLFVLDVFPSSRTLLAS